MNVTEILVQQRQQIGVILGRYFLFQNLVPGLLGIGFSGSFKISKRLSGAVKKKDSTFSSRVLSQSDGGLY
jgi:hypothetical protein